MNAPRIASRRLLLRPHASCLRALSTSVRLRAPATFQSYPLPASSDAGPPPARGDRIPETSIAHPTQHGAGRPPAQPSAQPSSPSQKAASASSASTAAPPPQLPEAAAAQKPRPARPRPQIRARKAAMRLTPDAVAQLRGLLDQPEPKLIRVGVRNRGCSGLAYHLEYVDRPAPLDEEVVQDGVKVLVDSKALFSIIGSEMDWVEDKLNQRFVFRNPNISESWPCSSPSFCVWWI